MAGGGAPCGPPPPTWPCSSCCTRWRRYALACVRRLAPGAGRSASTNRPGARQAASSFRPPCLAEVGVISGRFGPPGEDLTREYWHSTGHEARSSRGRRHTSRTSATAGPQDDRAAPSSTRMCPGGTRRQRSRSATHHRHGSRHRGGQARAGGHARSPGRPARHRARAQPSANYRTYIRAKPAAQIAAGGRPSL